ncbi:MAG TPA: hypothetical protein VJX67_24630, partial [Blastocatellia bacterium]|nr:hypothetical protein [Blastocatellia bacterium]
EHKKLEVNRYWTREQGLQALIDKTNPGLGTVVTAPPGPKQLIALLKATQARSGMSAINVRKGALIGLLAGIALGFAVFFLLAAIGLKIVNQDTFGNGMVGGFLGFAVGPLLGSYLSYRRQSILIAEDVLANGMAANQVNIVQLRQVLYRHRGLGRARRALNAIAPSQSATSSQSWHPETQANGSFRCSACNLVNFAGAQACKRCGALLA